MTTQKLSPQDKKDLDKFTKYLVYKCIQVIVQSRLGEKARTLSKPFSSGSDWFNVALTEHADVFSESRKAFSGGGGLEAGQEAVCVEMSLRTADGDSLVLETWSMYMSEQCEPSARVSYTVYNRMGILLKSLICVSRVMPAYRLSRKQSADSYIICYRIYRGQAQWLGLGTGYRTVRIGGVATPMGTINLQLMARTQMLISPQQHSSSHHQPVDFKDDHFLVDTCSAHRLHQQQPRPCLNPHNRNRRYSTGSHECVGPGTAPAAAADMECCNTTFSTSPAAPDTCVGSGLQHTASPAHRCLSTCSPDEHIHPPQHVNINIEKPTSFWAAQKTGAFAPQRESSASQRSECDDIPFVSLLQQQAAGGWACQLTADGGRQDAMEHSESTSGGGSSSSKSSSQHSANDDYVMVELKTPFAASDGNTDLGRFYQECQGAPPLSMFSQEHRSHDDAVNAITDQLAMFEANVKHYDDFLSDIEAA